VEELEGVSSSQQPLQPAMPADLDHIQKRIWEYLAEQPRHFDELARQLRTEIPELSRALMHLEMKKVVRRLPGNLYERP